jgi:hypothetical protein
MQRNQIIMYQNISFEVKRMAKEDLLAEKRNVGKIPANGESSWNHELPVQLNLSIIQPGSWQGFFSNGNMERTPPVFPYGLDCEKRRSRSFFWLK